MKIASHPSITNELNDMNVMRIGIAVKSVTMEIRKPGVVNVLTHSNYN